MAQRLLLVTERFAPDLGGVARSAARIAAALARLGVEVEVLAWSRVLPPGQLETMRIGGGDATGGEFAVHRLGLFGNLDYSLQHTLNVVEWLHGERRFDAVWGHYLFPAGFLAVWAAELLKVPSTVSARGNDVDRLLFPPGDFARLRWTLERAGTISSVSGELARKIDLLLGRDARVEVLGNAVDLEVFRPQGGSGRLESLPHKVGIRPEELVLGFCGELRHKKGLPFLLRALVEVRRYRPACLLVIGEVRVRDQVQLATFQAEEPEAYQRILITGQMDEPAAIADHLRLCDLFLQPSLWDGLPNAVLEAMACEKIVLASDAGGLPEAITHGETGFLLPRAQLHRLSEAILEITALPADRRAAIGRAARAAVSERFSSREEAAALVRVLRRLGLYSPA